MTDFDQHQQRNTPTDPTVDFASRKGFQHAPTHRNEAEPLPGSESAPSEDARAEAAPSSREEAAMPDAERADAERADAERAHVDRAECEASGQAAGAKLHAIEGGGTPEGCSWEGMGESGELERWFVDGDCGRAGSAPRSSEVDASSVREEMNKTRTLEFPPWLLRLATLYGEGRLTGSGSKRSPRSARGRKPTQLKETDTAMEQAAHARGAGSGEAQRGFMRATRPALPRNVSFSSAHAADANATWAEQPRFKGSDAPLEVELVAIPVRSYRSPLLGIGVAALASGLGLVILLLRPEAQPDAEPARSAGAREPAPRALAHFAAARPAPIDNEATNEAVVAERASAAPAGSDSTGEAAKAAKAADSARTMPPVRTTADEHGDGAAAKASEGVSVAVEGDEAVVPVCEGQGVCAEKGEGARVRSPERPHRLNRETMGNGAPF